jgi:hypothetical protein
MENHINKRLQNFLDKNPQFKGEFIGYKESRGGLGISRIDDDWYRCEDYLIPIDELIECLSKTDKIDLSTH